MGKGCKFQHKWLSDAQFKDWIEPVPQDIYSASCKICHAKLNLTTMGVSALHSHIKTKQHVSALANQKKSTSIASFCTNSSSSSTATSISTRNTTSTGSTSRQLYVSKEETYNAELWEVLDMVHNNNSFRSCENVSFVREKQFPDSSIAKNMSLGETKAMYLACFGLAPFFKRKLLKLLCGTDYVLIFDETLNEELQSKQCDFLVRIWEDNCVSTRYLTSEFMGHARADDLLECILKVTESFGTKSLLQIGIDGPAVNLSLYKKLNNYLNDNYNVSLLASGSCPLHTLHNSVKNAFLSVNWEIENILRSVYKVLHDTPARRADFEKVTCDVEGGHLWPLNFCGHRWLENIPVAKRVLDMFAALGVFVKACEDKKINKPVTMCYNSVKLAVADKVTEVRLASFISVCEPIHIFLQLYQTDRVMLPFLAADLEKILRSLLKRIVKPEILAKADSILKLVSLDFSVQGNQVASSNIYCGALAEEYFRKLKVKKLISERQELEVRLEMKKVILHIVEHQIDKSPLKFKLVRSVSALDPLVITQTPAVAQIRFKRCLRELAQAGKIEWGDVDSISDEFEELVTLVQHEEDFMHFDKRSGALEELFYDQVKNKESNLWKVLKCLLLLNHGQAQVERGFSVNKIVSRDNLSPHNLVSLRMVKDAIHRNGGLKQMTLTPELIKSASSARQMYMDYLARQREENSQDSRKRKRETLAGELDQIVNKIRILEKQVSKMTEEYEKLYDNAEDSNSLESIAMGNAMRKSVKTKREECQKLQKSKEEKKKELASLSHTTK